MSEMFKCTECDQEFDTQRGMNIHLANKHNKGKTKPKPKAKVDITLKFCPHCGENLEAVQLALQLLAKESGHEA